MTNKLDELKAYYENNLFEFAKYLNPQYVYGDAHEILFRFLSKPDALESQLVLYPRGHLKSHCVAVWVVWMITKEPWTSIIYLSAGDDLATVQMYSIKNMLLSDEYKLLWPDMVNKEESKRDKWATWAINVDHPLRRLRGTRDYTIIIKTIKSSATGLHCDHLVYDDIVVPNNAYTPSGRKEVEMAIADFSSVKNANARTKAVGTRYIDSDIYGLFAQSEIPIWNEESGEFVGTSPAWEILESPVEDRGDGTGNFLWPKTKSPITNTWYGFDPQVLATKKAEYSDLGKSAQFYAQYYNDPNDSGTDRIDRNLFLYYNKNHLEKIGSSWYVNSKKLELTAAMDCAWSDDTGTKKSASDWTAIAVIGMDSEGYYYILDLVKFKTSKFKVYYDQIMKLVDEWGFRKLVIETNSGGKFIKQEVDNMIRMNGRSLVTIARARTKSDGSKAERYAGILEPKYESSIVYHCKGGLIHELEDQITKARPKHDDLKDAVTLAFEQAKKPGKKIQAIANVSSSSIANSRFGGRRK